MMNNAASAFNPLTDLMIERRLAQLPEAVCAAWTQPDLLESLKALTIPSNKSNFDRLEPLLAREGRTL